MCNLTVEFLGDLVFVLFVAMRTTAVFVPVAMLFNIVFVRADWNCIMS